MKKKQISKNANKSQHQMPSQNNFYQIPMTAFWLYWIRHTAGLWKVIIIIRKFMVCLLHEKCTNVQE